MNLQNGDRVICTKRSHIGGHNPNNKRGEYKRVGVFKSMKNEQKAFVEFTTSLGPQVIAVPLSDISKESA